MPPCSRGLKRDISRGAPEPVRQPQEDLRNLKSVCGAQQVHPQPDQATPPGREKGSWAVPQSGGRSPSHVQIPTRCPSPTPPGDPGVGSLLQLTVPQGEISKTGWPEPPGGRPTVPRRACRYRAFVLTRAPGVQPHLWLQGGISESAHPDSPAAAPPDGSSGLGPHKSQGPGSLLTSPCARVRQAANLYVLRRRVGAAHTAAQRFSPGGPSFLRVAQGQPPARGPATPALSTQHRPVREHERTAQGCRSSPPRPPPALPSQPARGLSFQAPQSRLRRTALAPAAILFINSDRAATSARTLPPASPQLAGVLDDQGIQRSNQGGTTRQEINGFLRQMAGRSQKERAIAPIPTTGLQDIVVLVDPYLIHLVGTTAIVTASAPPSSATTVSARGGSHYQGNWRKCRSMGGLSYDTVRGARCYGRARSVGLTGGLGFMVRIRWLIVRSGLYLGSPIRAAQ
ncbi:hypothetical protein NDU88_000782 [Pleurodeles waltl]|uniref:Uncharacterized protein n=1 Tax=Pleurodeles waltl TaxID=8319 RepID=A0AAV7VXJ4_PLEWA|nr:hypothetical protein NDU88_000782 [Pleurodeles waltl]